MIQTTEYHRLIGEQQPLDVYEMVGTIASGHAIDNRGDTIDGRNRVVSQISLELRSVEVDKACSRTVRCAVCRGRIQELADCFELTWIVGAVEHEWHHVLHAIEAGDRWAGLVDVVFRIDTDTHVEPSVAIDNVLAVATHHDVATITAEDDVTGRKRCDMRPKRGVEHALQTIDKRYVGERTAPRRSSNLAANQVDRIVAKQIVVVLGPR